MQPQRTNNGIPGHQRTDDPDRPPIKVVIMITILLAIAAVAQTLAHLWTALTWPPAIIAAATLSVFHRFRPDPTIVTIRQRVRAIPGWPTHAIHRVLNRINQRMRLQRADDTEPDAEPRG